MATAAQVRANRENAKRSSGPRRTERTRFNGVTHGLCSVHPILPGEDPAAFQAENKGWFDDWQPLTHTRAVLVARAASLSWRLRRAVEAEADTRARDAERAGRDFDYEQAARVDRAAARFDDDPMAALTLLESHAAGLDRLLVSWSGLEAALESGPDGWDQELYHKRLLILQGQLAAPPPAGSSSCPLLRASSRLLRSREPGRSPLPPAEAAEAAETLRKGVAKEMDRVRELRKRAADPAIERARAMRAAGADTTKESQLRHRYEMALDRSLRGTINQLMALEKSGADLKDEPEIEIPAPAKAPTKAVAAPAGPVGPGHSCASAYIEADCGKLASVGSSAPAGPRPEGSKGSPGRPGRPVGADRGPKKAPKRS